MNAQEVLQILDKLKAIGAHHFKSEDFEVSIAEKMEVRLGKEFLPPEPPQAPPPSPHNPQNTQKVQELIDLLKMKDEQLVNTIFPEGA